LLSHCSPEIEAVEMPDCLRNGLCRCGWIAKIGRNYLDIDIGRPHKGRGDLRKLCRVAGNEAKMQRCMPSLASSAVMAAPIPRLAPVTSATFRSVQVPFFQLDHALGDDAAAAGSCNSEYVRHAAIYKKIY
jgi:hypothetical protein